MNKQEFLVALRGKLEGLPKEDIDKSLDFYSEMIEDRMEDGLEEAEAIEGIGSIEEIAEQILSERTDKNQFDNSSMLENTDRQKQDKELPEKTSEKKGKLKAWEIVLIVLGSPLWLSLLIAVFVIILAVYIVLWSVVISLYAVNLSFAAAAVAAVVCIFTYLLMGNVPGAILFAGVSMMCAGIAVLLFFGCNQIAKFVWIASKEICKGIKTFFTGKVGMNEEN